MGNGCNCHHPQPPSSAHVKIVVASNATFAEAYQFDPPQEGVQPPTWTLLPHFRMDVKSSYDQLSPLCSFSSVAGNIIIDDIVLRVIHFNVPESLIVPPLVPGEFVYDLIMYDDSVPAERIPLMHGEFVVAIGVTGG